MPFAVAMVSYATSGGHPTYVREVVSALYRHSTASDISVELVTSKALTEPFRSGDFTIHPVLPAYPIRTGMSWVAYKLRQFLYPLKVDRACIEWLSSRSDIHGLHFQDYYNLGSAFHIARYRKTGKWLTFTVHNIRPHKYYPFLRALMDALARYTWRRCDALFVHTEKLRSDLGAFLGKGHPPIHVTPHGAFDPHRVEPTHSLESRMRLKELLFFGVVRENKGLHTLLDAMYLLDGFSLTIAGRTNAEPAYWESVCRPRIESLRAKGRTIEVIDSFIPEESLHALWDAHSVAVLPYTAGFQAQSGVLFLAVGLETPVVASNVGGIAHTLEEHHIGEVMPSNDPEGLAEAVRRLYEAPLGELAASLTTAKQELSWDRNAERLLNVYRTLEELSRS